MLNRKLAGVILPAVQAGEDEDEAEDKSIKLLIESALGDLTYDGHKVHSVQVPCASSDVVIEGQTFSNEFIPQEKADLIQKLMTDKKMNKRRIKEAHPDISEELKIFYKHCDDRLHSYVFRKCHPKDANKCKYCKENPPRGSKELWETLPKKSSGGLFYDVEEDPLFPGHYTTLLQDVKNVYDIKIKPDNMFKNDEKFQRSEEKNCFCTFKSDEDGRRHMRLAHDSKFKSKANVCKWLINGTPCGESFETPWRLQQHKTDKGHKKTRVGEGSARGRGRGHGRRI